MAIEYHVTRTTNPPILQTTESPLILSLPIYPIIKFVALAVSAGATDNNCSGSTMLEIEIEILKSTNMVQTAPALSRLQSLSVLCLIASSPDFTSWGSNKI